MSVSTVLELHWHCQIKVQSGVHHGKLARSRPQQLCISPIPNLLSSLHMARFMSPQNLSLRTDYCTKHWEILCLSRRRNGADSFDLRIVALAHAAANDGCCIARQICSPPVFLGALQGESINGSDHVKKRALKRGSLLSYRQHRFLAYPCLTTWAFEL